MDHPVTSALNGTQYNESASPTPHPPPPQDFYAEINPRNWTVEVITKGLMIDTRAEKDIRDALKVEMERRHLIGARPDLSANRAKFAEAFTHLENIFPSIFHQDIPKAWLEKCKLAMARKITNSYLHCRKRKRLPVTALPSTETMSKMHFLPLGETGIFARSSLTQRQTIFHAPEILKEKKSPSSITSEELEFSMFKELLKEESVYRPNAHERIVCKIGGIDLEVDTARKFRAAALQMYRNGENPIAFTVEAAECENLVLTRRMSTAKARKKSSARRR